MNWKKSVEAALVSAGAAVFAAAPPLLTDGRLSGAEGLTLLVTFGAVFFAYLKTHEAPEDPK